jgi:hypothetical protein
MLISALALIQAPNASHTQPRARTFIVRLWLEDLGDGNFEWRGRVQDVISGQVTFFRGWERLVATIVNTLANRKGDAGDVSDSDLPTKAVD